MQAPPARQLPCAHPRVCVLVLFVFFDASASDSRTPPRAESVRAEALSSVKAPRPSFMTAARRDIHTSKSLYGLFRHNPDEHSRVQIAGVHAHEYDPAHCQASAAESFRAQPETVA